LASVDDEDPDELDESEDPEELEDAESEELEDSELPDDFVSLLFESDAALRFFELPRLSVL